MTIKFNNMCITQRLKKNIKKYSFLYSVGLFFQMIYRSLFPIIGKKNCFKVFGTLYKVKKDIIGNNNTVIIGKSTILHESFIRIHGNNNRLVVQDSCKIGRGSSFWIEGDNNKIIIRRKTTFTQFVHLCAQEENSVIDIGEDCMLSNNIIIRTSDSHPIYSNKTKERINPPKSVIIEKHVWIAPKATIMKGVTIGRGSVIGYQSVVTKNIPSNVLAVGSPALSVKVDINWSREHLF